LLLGATQDLSFPNIPQEYLESWDFLHFNIYFLPFTIMPENKEIVTMHVDEIL
jgi:hypothetical protein